MFIIRSPGDWLRSTTKSERGEFNESFLAQTKYKTSPGPPEQNPDRCKKERPKHFGAAKNSGPCSSSRTQQLFGPKQAANFFFLHTRYGLTPNLDFSSTSVSRLWPDFAFFSSVHRGIEASWRAGRMMKCRTERASKAFSFASLKQTPCLWWIQSSNTEYMRMSKLFAWVRMPISKMHIGNLAWTLLQQLNVAAVY